MSQKRKIPGYNFPIEKLKLYDVPAIELAKSLIERDPSIHISISDLAEKAGINEFKLKTGFRELFQTSPYQYRLDLCLGKARELLENTEESVEAIATKVGFASYSGFSTSFKRAFSLSPREYRYQFYRHNYVS